MSLGKATYELQQQAEKKRKNKRKVKDTGLKKTGNLASLDNVTALTAAFETRVAAAVAEIQKMQDQMANENIQKKPKTEISTKEKRIHASIISKDESSAVITVEESKRLARNAAARLKRLEKKCRDVRFKSTSEEPNFKPARNHRTWLVSDVERKNVAREFLAVSQDAI